MEITNLGIPYHAASACPCSCILYRKIYKICFCPRHLPVFPANTLRRSSSEPCWPYRKWLVGFVLLSLFLLYSHTAILKSVGMLVITRTEIIYAALLVASFLIEGSQATLQVKGTMRTYLSFPMVFRLTLYQLFQVSHQQLLPNAPAVHRLLSRFKLELQFLSVRIFLSSWYYSL